MYDSKINWALTYYSLCGFWMYFNFWFCFFIGISIEITSSVVGLKNCGITAAAKKFKSIINKKKKKHDKVVLSENPHRKLKKHRNFNF